MSALGRNFEKEEAEIWRKYPILPSSGHISPIQEGIRGGWDTAMGEDEHSPFNPRAIPAESPQNMLPKPSEVPVTPRSGSTGTPGTSRAGRFMETLEGIGKINSKSIFG